MGERHVFPVHTTRISMPIRVGACSGKTSG